MAIFVPPGRGVGIPTAVEDDSPGALLEMLELLVAEIELEAGKAGLELL
jgi:hypothetical protein